MGDNSTLYERIVSISQDYLGPAAERFVRRQIQTHLDKDPEDLRQKDMPELINWIRLTMSVLTNDTKVIDEFSERLANCVRKEQGAGKSSVT
jgi:hypothetical protein